MIKPYYEEGAITIYHGDALEILPELETVDVVFADPPYNIGKAGWDRIENYTDWCKDWVVAASRVLKAHGAFWVSHKIPVVLTGISEMLIGQGRELRNWITWDKYNGNETVQIAGGPMLGVTEIKSLRSFQVLAEYLIYHASEQEWSAQCVKERGFIFESLRAYLDGERKRAGIDKMDCNAACGFSRSMGGMASRHYFSRSQWCLPTKEHYAALRRLFNSGKVVYLRREYGDLQKEHADLRREYEHLRYTFNSPGQVSSAWQIAPASRTWHPTPKPEALLKRIIETTSNRGDLILDPFMGSGTTLRVAKDLGRRAIGIEVGEGYCAKTVERLAQETLIF